MTDSTTHYLIVGLGLSGLSVVRYLTRIGASFDVAETSVDRFREQLKSEPALRGVRHHASPLTTELLKAYRCVVVSPGISVRSEVFTSAIAAGVEVIGDVELFARAVTKPVIAVTGSNGKSTVVSMAGELLNAANIHAAVVGNVGVACLDSLQDDSIDAYVLELSSFQLETTSSLQPRVASVLNVSADHLDRYEGLDDYAEVKRSIYRNAQHAVVNLDNDRTLPVEYVPSAGVVSFSASNQQADWSIVGDSSNDPVLSGGELAEIASTDVKVAGAHNSINALAAMAMASLLIDADKKQMSAYFTDGFSKFTGLPHRTRLVCETNNIRWVNDSKGTNVGATVSAIKGMAAPVVLIAGGRGKNADYAPLRDVVSRLCSAVVLIGEEAEVIRAAIESVVPVYIEKSMQDAVTRAAKLSKPGECVLLSPACSSFDMFSNFEERGDVFEAEVRKLCA